MNKPSNLYRYRPLQDAVIDRELEALHDSYLFSSGFATMNDPMEAFYETGGPGDWIVNAMLSSAGGRINDINKMHTETLNHFALISFTSSYEYLPLWAYYGSNFAGMCLEFDTAELSIGDLQNEKLRPVAYAHNALPPLTFAELTNEEANIARITRKRIEWAHEKEWRFITGQAGKKHYLDDALRRVFLGPRVKSSHADRVCEVLDRRPVEVLQGVITGFNMTFRSIKPARPLNECERVFAGKFDPSVLASFEGELRSFLKVPYERLIEECQRISLKPNMKELSHADVSTNNKLAMYISTIYELRNGRDIFHRSYFDEQFCPLNSPS